MRVFTPVSSAVLACSLCSASAVSAAEVRPVSYLQSQTKPIFKAGHTLPVLSRFGYVQPFELVKELADNWGYALSIEGYLGDRQIGELSDPNSDTSRIIATYQADPGRYKISVLCNRYDPVNTPESVYAHDANGNRIMVQIRSQDGTTWTDGPTPLISPEAPDSYWDEAGRGRADPIATIRQQVPIAIVLHGGEWGLGVWGDPSPEYAGWNWMRDPTIADRVADYERRGLTGRDYLDDRKGNAERISAQQVKNAAPDRDLFIYYTTSGLDSRGRWWGWHDWGHTAAAMQAVGDLFSAQCYVASNNSGYLGTQDILTGQINNVAQRMALGGQISYDWFWSGWSPTTRRQYRGLLKCMYVMGTIGGNSGSYSSHDFASAFDARTPPDWLGDQIDLSHVHAAFSHLEDYLRNGALVDDGNYRHYWSNDLPAYELLPLELRSQVEDMGTFKRMQPGRAHRVLARKHQAKAEWLVVAWTAAAGSDEVQTPLTVDLPIAGRLNLMARAAGNLYLVRLVNGQTTAQLLDPNQDFPSEALASGALPAEIVQPGPTADMVSGDALNGSFELPEIAAYRYEPAGAGWTFSGASGMQRNGSAWEASNATGGVQTAFIQGSPNGRGSIARVIPLMAGSYVVQCKTARRYNALQPIRITIDEVQIGGLMNPTSNAFATYTSDVFTVTTGDHLLMLEATDGVDDKTTFIDQLAIVPASQGGIRIPGGDFEDPAIAAYQYNPGGSAWTFAGSSGIQRNGSAWGAANATDGMQTAFLQGNGGNLGVISQSLTLAAGTYQIRFDAARRSYGGVQSIRVDIDGVQLGATITPASTGFATYTTASITLSDGAHTLVFAATDGSGDNSAFIDRVMLIAGGSPPVASGSFETPATDSYQYNATGSNWTFTGGSGVQRNGSAWNAQDATDGVQTAFLQGASSGPGAIAQVVELEAGTYAVQFNAARRPGGIQPIRLTVDGKQVGSYITPPSTAFTACMSAPFTVDAGAHTIAFETTVHVWDDTSFIDEVQIIVGFTGPFDGGFESPATGTYRYNPTASPWIFSGASGVQRNGSAWGAAWAPEGVQTAFLQSGACGAIEQRIALAAGTYVVAAHTAQRWFGGVQPVRVSIDGNQVGIFAPPGTSFGAQSTGSFRVIGGIHTLTFQATTSAGDVTTFLDAVEIIPSGSG